MLIENNVENISPEEAKAILSGIVAIRQEADVYDYEADKGTGRYVYNSAAEKFGYDAWKFLCKNNVIAKVKQENLPI